jgi:HAD superfamily hydrolase (TIGR01490 family)
VIAALFDIEGTLFTAPMGYGFLRYARANRRRWRAWLYYARVMPRYYLSKLNLIEREIVFRAAIEQLAWLIQGFDLEQGAKAFDWVVQHHILPSGFQPVLSRLQDHQKQGHATLIVSSGLQPCLNRIAEHLAVTAALGTELEVKDQHFTGRILQPVLIGVEKGVQAEDYFTSRGIEVDWHASFAYADSFHDLSMFNLVGNPVAVDPDPELRQLAQQSQWEVID